MPQRLEQLRAAVQQLERELQSIDTVDEETRGVLERAHADIQTALQHNAGPPQPRTLIGQLESSLEQFETTHPTLAGAMRQVIEGLGRLGI